MLYKQRRACYIRGLPHFGAEMILGLPIWHKPQVFLTEHLGHKN